MLRYQLSPYVRIVSSSDLGVAMVYHALYGNPRVINEEGLQFLEFFKEPATIEEIAERCNQDPRVTVQEFCEIFFLIELDFDEKEFLRRKRIEYLSKVSARQTIDRMGRDISDSCNLGCAHCIHFQLSNNDGKALPIYQKSADQLNMSWETATR